MKASRKPNYHFRRTAAVLIGLVLLALLLNKLKTTEWNGNIYYDQLSNWIYAETDRKDADADVFYIAGTVFEGSNGETNWTNFSDATRTSLIVTVNSDKGIFDDNARFFSPFYRQVSLYAYDVAGEMEEKAAEIAYNDIKEAFFSYLENYNEGRPFILAGYSQGAVYCLQLLKDEEIWETVGRDKLIACYAIGWRVTQEDLDECPELKVATGETDTGVVISFNSEAPEVTESTFVPAGVKSLSINPLNWRTDETYADRTLNLGACVTDYYGEVSYEEPALTGAYIDPVRGTLKLTDIEGSAVANYYLLDSVYHGYDMTFFYRNLEENVQKRINAYYQGTEAFTGDF